MSSGQSITAAQIISQANADILVGVFSLCLPPHGGTFSLKEAPWNLGQVCRSWRQVVLNAPLLWNTIRIVDSDATSASHSGEILTEALRRTAKSKLHIYIETNQPYHTRLAARECRPLYELVQNRSADWESLRLVVYGSFPSIIPASATLPSLRRLEIEEWPKGCSDTGMLTELIRIVQDAPSVGHVYFQCRSREGRDALCSVPSGPTWRSLRTLEIHAYGEGELLAMLSASASQLEKLVLSFPNTTIALSQGIIHLPRLRILVLQYFIPTWWSRLSMPCLVHLEVQNMKPQLDPTPMFQMLRQNGELLRSISFIDIVFMDVTIERLLRLTPYIDSLTITGTLFPYIFDRLSSDPTLLPRMASLNVRSSTWLDNRTISPPLASVYRVAESRVDTLKVLRVQTLLYGSENEMIEKIRRLRHHGMLVHIDCDRVSDTDSIEIPEVVMLVNGVMNLAPFFGTTPEVRNREEIYLLLEYLLDVLYDEDCYPLDVIKKYYNRDLASLTVLSELTEEPSPLRQKLTQLIEKWNSILYNGTK